MHFSKIAFAGAAALFAAGAPAHSATPQETSAVMAAVNQFIGGLNEGNLKGAAAVCTDDAVVIDAVPPYVWRGPNACLAWTNALIDYNKDKSFTEGVLALGSPQHVMIQGDNAYVRVPASYSYILDGSVPINETGSVFTVGLRKAAKGWMINGWSWSDFTKREMGVKP